ncbi:MAG: AAA family ATPase [Clostridiales bacterium]|nr:AAA family ATPase [Clostridiales bacterium]
MFDEVKLKEALEAYKKEFYPYIWEDNYEGENFKWIAIKTFQDNWDIEAADFPDMLERALSKTDMLLVAAAFFPKAMILGFARSDPEGVRAMFRKLFDEDKDVVERIEKFKADSLNMLHTYGGKAKNHFQDEHVATIYLWLRYPDKYYIYRYGEAKKLAEAVGSDYKIKQGAYEDNLRNYIKLYDEVREVISHDEELISLLHSHLTDDCYQDTTYHTLTFDFSFYIRNYYSKGRTLYNKYDGWFPTDYSPEISVDDWVELLQDKSVFTPEALKIVKRMKDYGGQATCTQLSKKYGNTINFYNRGSVALAQRIIKKTNCPLSKKDDGSTRYWSVLYTGKYASSKDDGVFIWRLRDELSEAIDKVDLSSVPLYDKGENPSPDPKPTAPSYEPYTCEDFFNDVYMSAERYEMLRELLLNKMNVILQGPPGVGKTFSAKKLAYSIMGVRDDSRIEMVQFHQNYSYEDFIMGYRPDGDSFKLTEGIFYSFCQKAGEDSGRKYFFIIDEINRGNLSKILGELMMTIEKDYRNTEVTLAYNGKRFSVPDNLYIIGMMNTADRSLAMIDYALRRRFSFFNIVPGFDSDGFKKYQAGLKNEIFDALIEQVKKLNKAIAEDSSLGKDFMIGHSYFCGRSECTDVWMRSVVEFDIIPMLEEYWFDEPKNVSNWAINLRGVFNDK